MSRLTAIVAFGVLAAGFVAAVPPASAAVAKTRVLSVLITSPTVTATGAQCLVEYSNNCSSGTCTCMALMTPTVRGTLVGRGSSITGDVQITTDVGAATNSGNSTEPGCNPVFADIAFTNGSLLLDTAVLLTSCPTNRPGTSTLNGGWSIESASNDETGGGSATGTIKNGTLTLKLAGAVTIPAM